MRGINNDGICSNMIDRCRGEDSGDRSDDFVVCGGGGARGYRHGNSLVQKGVIVMIVDVTVLMRVRVMLVMMCETRNFFLASLLNLLAFLVDLDKTAVLSSFALVVTSEGLALAFHDATRVMFHYLQ